MDNPGALLLSPESPFPVHGGGALRTASLHAWLEKRHGVDLVVFQERGQAPCPGAAAVIDLPRHSRAPLPRALRNLRRYAAGVPPLIDRFSGCADRIGAAIAGRRYRVGVIEHLWAAPYAEVLTPHCERLFLDLHNIESVWLERCGAAAGRLASVAFRRWADRCRELETELLPRFDAVLVPSEVDAALVAGIAPGTRTIIYPNAVPCRPRPAVTPGNSIVFSGNLEYQPNITAFQWFRGAVWPRLRVRRPDLEWRVVGRNHERLARTSSDDPRIRFTGPVDDALTALASSRVAVAPIQSGSGTRLKIIEAWAAGLPVVSTPLGAEGLPGRDGEHLLLAASPDDFEQAISRILDDPDLSAGLAARGRELFEARLTWERAWEALDMTGL